LVTDFTPLTALATRTAPLISARELTKPLSQIGSTPAIARVAVLGVKCSAQCGSLGERNERARDVGGDNPNRHTK
jgi:hypothetical protein